MTTAGHQPRDGVSDGLEGFAELLGHSPAEVADALGGGWLLLPDCPAVSFGAGSPLQVIVTIERDGRVVVAQPHLVWDVHRPVWEHGLVHLTAERESVELGELANAIDSAADAERRHFRWCRDCRSLIDPGHWFSDSRCMGCAEAHGGVVF